MATFSTLLHTPNIRCISLKTDQGFVFTGGEKKRPDLSNGLEFCNLKKLKQLAVLPFRVQDYGQLFLAVNCPSISRLHISIDDSSLCPFSSSALRNITSIELNLTETINFQSIRGDRQWSSKIDASHLPNLKHLRIYSQNCGGIESIRLEFPHLETLHVNVTEAIIYLENMIKLQKVEIYCGDLDLQVDNCSLQNRDITNILNCSHVKLLQLRKCNNISRLNFGENSKRNVKSFKIEQCKQLEFVGCDLPSIISGEIHSCSHLKTLVTGNNLSYNRAREERSLLVVSCPKLKARNIL